jgi:hypothetical protein
MTTYRKTYALKCGSMVREFGSKKPTFEDLESFIEKNSPTNNEIELKETLVEVPTLEVSRPRVH